MRLLSISADPKILQEGSAVQARQLEHARGVEELHIIVFTDRTGIEHSLAPNCFVYPTRSRSRLMRPFDAIRLGRFIIERRRITDIMCQDPFFTGMAGVSLRKQFGRRLEIQVHTDIGSPHFAYSIANRIRKAMGLSFLPKADHIRVVSERIKTYLVEKAGITADKIEVRPIAVDTDAVKNAIVTPATDLHVKYPQFDRIILMASRLTREKNIGLALEAMPTILERKPKTGLVIVGEGPLEGRLARDARALGISDSVIFGSWADKPALYSYYKTCEAFLVTSLFEGYGMTLVEAAAAGARIISTDVGVAREVGARIIAWDVGDVARAIENLLL